MGLWVLHSPRALSAGWSAGFNEFPQAPAVRCQITLTVCVFTNCMYCMYCRPLMCDARTVLMQVHPADGALLGGG